MPILLYRGTVGSRRVAKFYWAPWELELLKLKKADGEGNVALGAFFGVPRLEIAYRCRKLRIRHYYRWDEILPQVKERLAWGYNAQELAEFFEVTPQNIWQLLRRFDLKVTPRKRPVSLTKRDWSTIFGSASCQECGKVFPKNASNQKSCSDTCRQALYRKKRKEKPPFQPRMKSSGRNASPSAADGFC